MFCYFFALLFPLRGSFITVGRGTFVDSGPSPGFRSRVGTKTKTGATFLNAVLHVCSNRGSKHETGARNLNGGDGHHWSPPLATSLRGLCAFVWFRHRWKCLLRFVIGRLHVSLTSMLFSCNSSRHQRFMREFFKNEISENISQKFHDQWKIG